MSILPEGRLIKIEFEFRLPITATEAEVSEWVRYKTSYNGSIACDNPLCDEPLQPWQYDPALTDTGRNGRIEESDHEPTENGGVKYRVRYIREPST